MSMAKVITTFLKFFQDYINLCQSNNWPNDETTLEEIRNSFLISQHIEKCLDKLQQKCFIDEFLSALNKDQNTSSLFLKQCFSDPPKYILKKIINSSTNISVMDAGFSIFLELFSENKLEMCLSDFMLEAASKETLLKNLVHHFPKDILLELKSVLFLSEIHSTKNSSKIISGMLENTTRDTMDILLLSLLNKDIKYHHEVSVVLEAFLSFMSKKKDWMISQKFWNVFFNTEITTFLKICLHYANIFKHVSKILVDCGQLIQENISLDFFYINLTHSELSLIVKTICNDENLKLEFFDIIQELNQDASFWYNLLST